MINHLNNMLRRLLRFEVIGLREDPTDPPETVDEQQINFQAPDQEWRSQVSNSATRHALNVYLFDLRENRKLRSNERVRFFDNGKVSEEPAPARVDCHYLITAWSPAIATPHIEPTVDEHILLYQATKALMNNAPLNASRIFPSTSPELTEGDRKYIPDLIREADLPTQILPVEGFPKLAEFWGTMGTNQSWKPGIYLVVTLPVAFEKEISGPMVTTRITEYRRTGHPETSEVLFQIGGHVLHDDQPVAYAWVQLEDTGVDPLHDPQQTTETNELGRFTFGDLHGGSYRIRVRARGFGEIIREVYVPSPTGEYDLTFT